MKYLSLALITLLFISFSALAQNLSVYQKHLFIKNTDTLPYRLLLPENYDAAKKYPLIIFLHGSGERGNDNELQLVHGGNFFLKNEVRKNFPAIIVFPQCPLNSFWSNVSFKADSAGKRIFNFQSTAAPSLGMKLANALLLQVIEKYRVNKKQVYVGGLSMGGMGTFEIAARNPKLFAAAFPICGGGDPATAKKIRKIKWWVFHGAKDDGVPPSFSTTMVNALRKAHANVQFSLYPNANHNSWDAAFAEPELMKWLFAQHK